MEADLRQLLLTDHNFFREYKPQKYTTDDILKLGGRSFLPVQLFDRQFFLPGFNQGEKTKFVPFFRDDPFLSMCAAVELSEAIIFSGKKPSIMISPPSSKSEKMARLVNAFTEQLLLTITQQNVDIPLLRLAARSRDEVTQIASRLELVYRFKDGIPYYLDIPMEEQQVIAKTLTEEGFITVVDDVRRTGHTERCILELIKNVVQEDISPLIGNQIQYAYVAVESNEENLALPKHITTVMVIP